MKDVTNETNVLSPRCKVEDFNEKWNPHCLDFRIRRKGQSDSEGILIGQPVGVTLC